MDNFNEIMEGYTPMEISQKIYFGDFNPNADYFYFNGYANLESIHESELIEQVENGNFKSNDDLFHFNDNGELISYTQCDYEEYVYDSIDYIEEDIELIVRDSNKNNDLKNIIKDLSNDNIFKQILISLED